MTAKDFIVAALLAAWFVLTGRVVVHGEQPTRWQQPLTPWGMPLAPQAGPTVVIVQPYCPERCPTPYAAPPVMGPGAGSSVTKGANAVDAGYVAPAQVANPFAVRDWGTMADRVDAMLRELDRRTKLSQEHDKANNVK
jgi:hypothetical protein